MMTADRPLTALLGQAWRDLQPFDGRFDLTWRVALVCALVTGLAMVLRVPEAAISCYLVIFLMKEDAVTNCVMGIGVILLATLVVFLMVPVINVAIDSPAMRFGIIFGVSCVFLFLASATPLGEQAAIVALIVAFIMTLVTYVPAGQIANQGLLAAWKMASLPMAVMILFSLAFGTPAQTLVRRLIVKRLTSAAESLAAGAETPETAALLGEGNAASRKQIQLVRALHLVPKESSTWLRGAVETSYLMMLVAPVSQEALPPAQRHAIATAMRDAARAIDRGERPAPPDFDTLPEIARPLEEALAALAGPEGGTLPAPEATPFLAPDAFSDPKHQRYAIKTSVAAVICYLIYSGLQWDDIHTALITCYVVALGTTGETMRKLTLRITGCLIGAAMGVAALLFVMPWLTSVGGLMILVFCGVLMAGWVSSGNERISYAGVQIALAFLLTVLNGFGPSFEFSQAGSRIIGILVGLFVISVIFTQFWPTSISRKIREEIAEIADRLLKLAAQPRAARLNDLSTGEHVQTALEELQNAITTASFEPRHQRADDAALAQYHEARSRLAALHNIVRFEREVSEAALDCLRRYARGNGDAGKAGATGARN